MQSASLSDSVFINVIIVTYNGEQWIEQCIESILYEHHAETFDVQIIVIDNDSKDATRSIVQRFENVKLINTKENLGFGRANNIGLQMALENQCDYVYLFNQDAYNNINDQSKEYTETLQRMVAAHQKEPHFGIISPIHLDGKGQKMDVRFEQFVRYSKTVFFKDNFQQKSPDKLYPVDFVNAAAWLLPIETVKKVGGFNPLFFYRGEDNDYCNRVLFHGFKIGICIPATIRHDRAERLNRPKSVYHPDINNQFLATLLNPNQWKYKNKHLIKLCLFSIANFFKALIRFDFKFIVRGIKSGFSLLTSLPKLGKLKKQVKEKSTHFLT